MQRIALIGCGNISRFHLAGWQQAGAAIAWVCDLDAALAAKVAATVGAKATGDYREALADPTVTAVDVTTFSGVHRRICCDAFAAGKHVVCEKTLAENAEDAWAITQAAEAAGRVLFTNYMKRFVPAVERAKALMPSLGKIIQVNVRAWQCWDDLWGAPRPGSEQVNAERKRKYGGGIVVCGGSHVVDLANHFCGRPRRVSAVIQHNQDGSCDNAVTALFDTATCPVTLSAVAHPLDRIGFLKDGWDEQVEILGSQGRVQIFSAVWDDPGHKASLLVHEDRATGASTEHRFAPASAFSRAMAAFASDLDAGANRVQSRLTGYETDEVIAAMLRSSATGQTVEIAWRDQVRASAAAR